MKRMSMNVLREEATWAGIITKVAETDIEETVQLEVVKENKSFT
jgi:hypothetical protein